MRKRSSVQSTISPELDSSPKRCKLPRKSDLARQDPAPQWLHDAAAAFVANTPPLNWTGGFYSWGTWLDHLRSLTLWSPQHPTAPAPPWRALIDACCSSRQVHGTAALYRAKSDLVTVIINYVYRRAEAHRFSTSNYTPPPERDVMRRVRAVVTRQRRHESVSLTLIRFLDFAFVFSAYKDCHLAAAARENAHSLSHISNQVEAELLFLDAKPTAKEIREATLRMESFMWQNRWLPWYEQVPGVRDEMVIRAREAALSFCDGIPFPQLNVRTGVRGLPRDHLAGSNSMNEWLFSLFDPSISSRWAQLSAVYETAVRDERGEEDPLLEETSRRVVEIVLKPMTEVKDSTDAAHSKLVDATPGIVVTQSLRIPGRFTFRQLLELHIHLALFSHYLHSTFHGCRLPSVQEIHSGVVLFEGIRSRVLDVRSLIDNHQAEILFRWCLAIPDSHKSELHPTPVAHKSCIAYQKAAIRAALGPAVMVFCRRPKDSLPESQVAESDPLAYAALIAEWDPPLAARIIDAAVRINHRVRNEFLSGNGEGVDLYTHRRVLVCDAAIDSCRGDTKAAARIMTRLHPVWDVFEADKCVGKYDQRGAMALKIHVGKGNFEAAAAFGALLCNEGWAERRRACRTELDIEKGIVYLCKAVSMGDTGAACDLIHLLQSSSIVPAVQTWKMPQRVSDYVIECFEVAAREEPSLQLFLGYLHSLGAPGIPADCKRAIKSYQMVLQSHIPGTAFQAFAANNIGALKALNSGILDGTSDGDIPTEEYFKAAAFIGDKKAESNLAAVLLHDREEGQNDLNVVTEIYGRCFNSSNGNSPVTVIQTNRTSNQMTIFEMLVESGRQDKFCKDLKAEGMKVEQYGKVLVQEVLPCSSGTPTGNKENKGE